MQKLPKEIDERGNKMAKNTLGREVNCGDIETQAETSWIMMPYIRCAAYLVLSISGTWILNINGKYVSDIAQETVELCLEKFLEQCYEEKKLYWEYLKTWK